MYAIMNRVLRTVLAAVVVCAAVGCVMGPRKTPEQRAADRDMAERVQVALSADRVLYSRHITVSSDGGVITLSGYVWTPEELVEAKEDAQGVPGVIKVVDRMEVDRGGVGDSAVTR